MSNNKNKIKNKISDVLNSLKDLETLEIAEQIDDENQLFDYSNLLGDISSDPEIACGAEIGQWKIIELLGRGGMSIVYLVERNDDQLKQHAALKVIPNGLASNTMVERFMRERQILSDLNHPNIAQLYDAGVTEQGAPWFVMEYIQGEDIIEYAKINLFNTEQRISLFKQVCNALAYAHAHCVVHRDIKPSNILVNQDKIIKLLDFGIASSDEQQSLTMTGAVIGTPGYMSPEQAQGLGTEIDRRSDIFSLGVLLYKLIKHDMPFHADSISEISYRIIHDEPTLLGNKIPVELQAITFKCLEKKVENRYPSVKQLLKDLDAYLNGEVVSARKITLIGRLFKKIKKQPIYSAFIFSATILSILGVGYGIYQSFESVKKLQVSEKYLAKTQDIKAKIRRIHMMPLHDIKQEYVVIEKEIENLRKEIESREIDHSGLSHFALGEAYFNMKKYDKAYDYYNQAKIKGWKSKELSSGLGLTLLEKWQQDEVKAASMPKEAKQQFLASSKKVTFLPAIHYLKEAQLGASNVNYLAAQMAFGEKNYDKTIEYIQKEIKANPWHYEALRLASEVYMFKFKSIGQKRGYDVAIQYMDLSNEALEQSIQIGRSDPYNYISRCFNSSVDVQIKKILKLDSQLKLAFEKGIKYCQGALKLNPEAHSPWSNLNLIYVTKGYWLEDNKRDPTSAYTKALEVVESGLVIHPDNAILMSLKIKPLLYFAVNAIKHNKDPNLFYLKSLEAGKEAIELNPKLNKALFELARTEHEYGQYHLKHEKDYKKAEHYFKLSLEKFKKNQNNNPSITNILNISASEVSLYKVKLAQKQIPKAISYLQKSINRRKDVLPRRSQYFNRYKDLLQEVVDLLALRVSIGDDIKAHVSSSVEFLNEICQFDGLSQEQKAFIKTLMNSYVEKQWIETFEVTSCQ